MNENPIKILFLLESLRDGGAERVLVNLANHMDKAKFDITIETIFTDGINKKMLSPDIKYFCKHMPRFKGLSYVIKFIPQSFLYKKIIGDKKYDVIVAYMHGLPTKVVAGCKNSQIKKISWLHNGNPETGSFFDFWISKKKGIAAYIKMDALAAVSESVSKAFEKYTGIKSETIYNTIDTDRVLQMSNEPSNQLANKKLPTICAVGKVIRVKGYDRLVEAVARLKKEGFDFHLLILGEIFQKGLVVPRIEKLGLEDDVELYGFCKNPYSIMAKADALVMSSRSEGLPTVIIEALTLGLPVVATDVSGAREILGNNNEYGLVVDNSIEGIYEGLKKILTDEELVKKYRASAKMRSKNFDVNHTVARAESFIEKIVSGE